jgi:hypothetical protein
MMKLNLRHISYRLCEIYDRMNPDDYLGVE